MWVYKRNAYIWGHSSHVTALTIFVITQNLVNKHNILESDVTHWGLNKMADIL